ncbi:MAG: glycosyltransferase [Bacteroidetes bacterium]|nr:glycosyltransferase [Bacteroidota bacterium]
MKHLVLLCDDYPNSDGEFFLDDEMKIISNKFEKITILCSSPNNGNCREIPKNANVIVVQQFSWFNKWISRISGLFFLPLWKEFIGITNYGIKPNLSKLKLLFSDYVQSSMILNSIKLNDIQKGNNFIYYSYWHDQKALTLARLRKNTNCTAVARCHRWDLYFYANNSGYIPFKKYILSNLTFTASISQDGIKYMQDLHGIEFKEKIKLSRLGKLNDRTPNYIKKKNEVIICSCSHFNSFKRVHLIPKILKNISNFNIRWVHFGWGFEEYEELVKKELLAVNFKFELMGKVDNEKILDFYRDNFVDIFISTSASEGVPVSMMEALSSGIPVFATNVGGVSEIVNNESGFLVPKDFDVLKVANEIESYLLMPLELQIKKRKAARQQWELNYDAKKNYNDFINLILNAQ